MKKIAIRIIGALCLIGALAVLVFPAWVQVEGISRKDMRTMRTQLTEDLDRIEENLLYILNAEDVQEDLKENDLPKTSGRVKGRFRNTEELLREILDDEVSFKEVFSVLLQVPQYIEDTANFLDTKMVAKYLFEFAAYSSQSDIEAAINMAQEINYAWLINISVGVLALIIGLCLISAITHCLNKVRYIKYLFAVVIILLVAGVCIGVPVVSTFIQENVTLPQVAEELELRTTAMPYVALLLTLVPIALDVVFERKKKAAVEG